MESLRSALPTDLGGHELHWTVVRRTWYCRVLVHQVSHLVTVSYSSSFLYYVRLDWETGGFYVKHRSELLSLLECFVYWMGLESDMMPFDGYPNSFEAMVHRSWWVYQPTLV